jgi:uncharacterized protein YdhG (YjbR/CyaY superfamily)
MQSKARTVDEYLAGVPDAGEREFLGRLRALIVKELPGATESMAYGMPTYQKDKDMLCAFNRQKNYFSLYAKPDAIAAHAHELKGLDCGKSCIRFRRTEELPWPTARQIIRACAG